VLETTRLILLVTAQLSRPNCLSTPCGFGDLDGSPVKDHKGSEFRQRISKFKAQKPEARSQGPEQTHGLQKLEKLYRVIDDSEGPKRRERIEGPARSLI